MSPRRIKKRDGREVAFDKAKIAAAVQSAQDAVGESDPVFAQEVADLVELALRRRHGWRGPGESAAETEGAEASVPTIEASIPTIEEVQDLVEVGLVELGRAAVAKAYILYRDRRGRVRGVLEQAADGERFAGQLRHVQVREARGHHPWSKSRVVAALVQEAELSREQAEQVAARVEARVVASQLKRLSTALIRELVDNELVAMGLSGALARQAPVAIPRYDLGELLREGARSPVARRAALDREPTGPASFDLGRVVAGELFTRYAGEDLFAERVAEGHTGGALHVEDLRAPHLYLHQGVRCELFLRGEPGVRAAFDALSEVAAQLAHLSRGIVLENPAALLRDLTRPGRGDEREQLATWLFAAAALARGSGKRVDLAAPGTKAVAFTSRLVATLDELAELDAGEEAAWLPRLYIDRAELRSLLDSAGDRRAAVARLLERGGLVPTWAPAGEAFLGPAGRRMAREQGAVACGGAVGLNLARLARRAGPWREDLFLESAAQLVEEGVEALASLGAFQRRARAAREGELRGRVAYALTPVGLLEALRVLGDGELRAEQGARILGLLSEAARRFSAARGIGVHLSPHFGAEAAGRFALADADPGRGRQGLLFESAAPPGAEVPRARTRGYSLGPLPGALPGLAEAQLLATVPAGSWAPLEPSGATLREGGAEAQLEAWELFDEERQAIRRSTPGALEVPRTAPFFHLDPIPAPPSGE